MRLIQKIDNRILLRICTRTQNRIFDKVMPYITALGDWGIIWIAISLFLIYLNKYRNIGLMCVSALILTSVVGEGIVKHLIQRPRPFTRINTLETLISEPLTYSFPSGHTASSFAVALIIAYEIKMLLFPVLILAILISFSRLYLLVHYPSDIIGGIVLGVICSYAVIRFGI